MTSMNSAVILGSIAFSVLLAVAAGAMWIIDRHGRARRIAAATGNAAARARAVKSGPREQQQMNEGLLNFMKRATQSFSIMKDRQIRETRLRLLSAGYRSRDAIVVYSFFKLVSPLAAMAGGMLAVYGFNMIGKGPALDLAGVLAIALLGSKLPDIVVTNTRQKRLDEVRKAFPDALDMLVICAEAGLSSDSALKRVVAETNRTSSILGAELELTAMEMNFSPDRRAALENLLQRVPLPAVTAFVNTMLQAEKYGTPLARAFRVLANEQRTERMLRAEEKAGRLPAIMTVPMMLFILPALFIVLIGPAALDIMDKFIGVQ